LANPRREIRKEAMRSSSTAASTGGPPDAEALFGALYSELHRLARRQLSRGVDAGLGVTTLLHEAYLDMSARHGAVFTDEAHFMAYAARVMRGLIIDHARAAHASKRGGEFELTSLRTDAAELLVADPCELSAIGDALDELAAIDPRLAEVVDLKFFCGLSFAEIAVRGWSERTAQRKWEKARIYLHARIRQG
jgi:RNA polymerase sigma factor (TIGR02999 family)